MNKQLRLAVLALSVAGFVPGFAGAHADMSPQDREKKMNQFASDLNLTPEQKTKVRSIKEDKYRKIDDAERTASEQIRALLNPDQQAKYDKMKEKH